MIATNGKTGKIPTAVEIAFYVLILVGLIYGAVFLVNTFTTKKTTLRKDVESKAHSMTKNIEDEMKGLEEENNAPAQPQFTPPPQPTQPIVQAPPVQQPMYVPPPQPYRPPQPTYTPPYRPNPNEPFVMSSVAGASSN